MKMPTTTTPRMARCSALIALLALAAPLALAELPGRSMLRRTPRASLMAASPADAAPLTGVLVTDIDPAKVAAGEGVSLHPGWNGPFHAHQTLAVWVVTVMDRRSLGSDGLDVVTRFILPDGSLYQTMTTPVDPNAAPGGMVERPDLSPPFP
ncbi:MAG: hypothetical protein Q9Q13_08260 [Acidobacteriota bacterium]|nr:hypothetical protein [Acidobacteriota bacterium]